MEDFNNLMTKLISENCPTQASRETLTEELLGFCYGFYRSSSGFRAEQVIDELITLVREEDPPCQIVPKTGPCQHKAEAELLFASQIIAFLATKKPEELVTLPGLVVSWVLSLYKSFGFSPEQMQASLSTSVRKQEVKMEALFFGPANQAIGNQPAVFGSLYKPPQSN